MRTVSQVIALIGCGVLLIVAAESASDSAATDADATWGQLTAVLKTDRGPKEDRVRRQTAMERALVQYRQEGLAFFDRFPGDIRRWEWLLKTLQHSPAYWANLNQGARMTVEGRSDEAQIDDVSQGKWDELVRRKLRPEFLSSPQVTSEQRAELHQLELNLIQRRFIRARTITENEVGEFTNALLAYSAEPAILDGGSGTTISWAVGQLRHFIRSAQMDIREERMIVHHLKSSSNQELRAYAAGMERVLELRDHPLELRLTTLDGTSLDVADWHGKVVLVDIWSTGCKSCVEAIPQLKEIYGRYHDRGFAMVAVCLDSEKNRRKVDDILRDMNPPWPTAWVELAQPLRQTPLVERFAITGVPVYFLLDQTGRLVGTDYGGKDGKARLEQDVQRLLGISATAEAVQ